MLTNEQLLAVLSGVRTRRIMALAAELEALDLLPDGPALGQACELMAARLSEAGAHQVALRSYPSGPEHSYLGWTGERRTIMVEASLWLLTPDGGEVLICRTSDDPSCAMGSFRSTGPDGEVFEVVDVGLGTRQAAYRGIRAPGKLALATGHHIEAAMLEALAQGRTEGMLCGPGSDGADFDRVVPNRLGEPSLFSPHRPFGFNLSAHQYSELVNLLASGTEVRVRARIRVAMDTGELPVVSAHLEGTAPDHGRIMIVAAMNRTHGALGAACLHEVLGNLGRLIAAGALPPLRRALQVLLVPEALGTVAYLAEREGDLDDVRAVLHLEVPSPSAATRIEILHPSPSRPSFVPDLLVDHLRWARSARVSLRGDAPMALSTDQDRSCGQLLPFAVPNDGPSLVSAGIICTGDAHDATRAPSSSHGPLHRLTAAATATALELCNLQHEDLPRVLCCSHLQGHRRLARRAELLQDRIRQELHNEHPSTDAGRHLLWLTEGSLTEGLHREEHLIASSSDFLDGPGQHALGLADTGAQLKQARDALARRLGQKIAGVFGPRAKLVIRRRKLTALERLAGSVVVHRRHAGPLPLPYLMREAAAADRTWLAQNAPALAAQPGGQDLIQRTDSKRTLLEIFDLICMDLHSADLKLIWRYLKLMEQAGLLELEEISRMKSV